ncbi:MAG: Maf family protein, partial [bacterium]
MWDKCDLPPLLLASRSPRRMMLLRQIGIPFEVVEPDGVRERVPEPGENFSEVVVENALAKATSVSQRFRERLVVGADTLVDWRGRALGKPSNPKEAREMLMTLSGDSHRV